MTTKGEVEAIGIAERSLIVSRDTSFVHIARLRSHAEGKQVMAIGIAELDRLQKSYKDTVEVWVAASQYEEALASVNHTVRRSINGSTPPSVKRRPERK